MIDGIADDHGDSPTSNQVEFKMRSVPGVLAFVLFSTVASLSHAVLIQVDASGTIVDSYRGFPAPKTVATRFLFDSEIINDRLQPSLVSGSLTVDGVTYSSTGNSEGLHHDNDLPYTPPRDVVIGDASFGFWLGEVFVESATFALRGDAGIFGPEPPLIVDPSDFSERVLTLTFSNDSCPDCYISAFNSDISMVALPVPEPPAIGLLIFGLLGLAVGKRGGLFATLVRGVERNRMGSVPQ